MKSEYYKSCISASEINIFQLYIRLSKISTGILIPSYQWQLYAILNLIHSLEYQSKCCSNDVLSGKTLQPTHTNKKNWSICCCIANR